MPANYDAVDDIHAYTYMGGTGKLKSGAPYMPNKLSVICMILKYTICMIIEYSEFFII